MAAPVGAVPMMMAERRESPIQRAEALAAELEVPNSSEEPTGAAGAVAITTAGSCDGEGEGRGWTMAAGLLEKRVANVVLVSQLLAAVAEALLRAQKVGSFSPAFFTGREGVERQARGVEGGSRRT